MRLIGIDPGSRKTGIGILDYDPASRKFDLVDAFVLRLDVHSSSSDRFAELAVRFEELLGKYKPEQAVLEDVFVGQHARSALILGQARGVILGVLGLEKIPVLSMAPRQVKQLLTGQGQANKDQVAQMACVLLNLPKKPAEDAADALALALAYALAPETTLLVPRPKKLSSKQKREALEQLALRQRRAYTKPL